MEVLETVQEIREWLVLDILVNFREEEELEEEETQKKLLLHGHI